MIAPFAYAAGEWRQKLASGITSEDSRVRADAVRSVEVDEKGAVPALLSVLSMKEMNRVDGYIRSVAIGRLAAAKEPKTVEAVAKALVAKDPAHREAAALALGAPERRAQLAAVGKLLDDKDAGVRRAALRAIGRMGELEGVDLLLKRWEKLEKEKARDFREVLLLEEALGKLTEAAHGRERARWAEWWEKNRAGYKRPSEWTEEEKKAAAEARKKALEEQAKKEEVSTTLRDVPLNYTASGKGDIPLLVIHDDTWNPRYLSPYLSSLEDICRVYYMELPSITKLQIKKRNIGGFPYWPYDELCDAFDEMRKQGKHEKFAILAHGFSTMIAMRYLSKYGENVSHAILVGAFPGDDAYGNMLDKLSAKATGQLKDRELDNAIKFHFITDEKTFTRFYSPKSNDELEALERKFFTIMFANPQDPEIAEIWDRCKRPGSTDMKIMESEQCQSPPFDILREQKPKVPVLVISGAKSIWFGPADGDRVAKNYPLGQHVVLPNSSMMPWFEESAAFADAVKQFFAKNPLPKK
jgi:pimeloyl-ACP methyl ester carboxylesterase